MRRGASRAHFLEMPLPQLLDETISLFTEKLQLIRDVESDVILQR